MIYNRFVRVLLFIGMVNFAGYVWADENCKLVKPPRAAGLNAFHGYFVFVFPRQIPPQYTGCQTMWNEDGKPLFVIEFKRGNAVLYKEFGIADLPASIVSSKPTKICRYPVKLDNSSRNDCPDGEGLQIGFLTVPVDQEPVVPPQRDPRKD